jgi:hypothetical protein
VSVGDKVGEVESVGVQVAVIMGVLVKRPVGVRVGVSRPELSICKVTWPFLAKARPSKVEPVRKLMSVRARMVPLKLA